MRGGSRYFSNQRLFLASVARRRRFVYDVSVCPVGDMDGPKTAQVMSKANVDVVLL